MLRLILLLATLPVFIQGQQTPAISVQQVMSAQEMVTTGVAGLSPAQRAALDRWLTEYTLRVFQVAQSSQSTNSVSPRAGTAARYLGTGKHWIKSKADNGAFITLEDGSVWEINSIDRIDTALWLPITDIVVLEAKSPIGEFNYMLVNTEDGEKALAKYMGKE